MNETQTWTALIGLLTASATAFAFIWRLTTQTLGAQLASIHQRFDSVEQKFSSRFDAIDSKFEGVDSKFEGVGHQFDAMGHRIDALGTKIDELGRRTSLLEDDVRAITRHLFDGPEAA